MTSRRIAIIGGTVVALAAGTAGAVAATKSDEPKEREKTVLDTAAKDLNVSPEELRRALRAGQEAQLAQAVKDGKLTQKQADAIKQEMEARGLVLGGGPGGPGGHHGGPGGHRGGPGGPGGRQMGADIAKALGLTEAELREQIEDGKTIAEIAKAENKQLDDVKQAVKKAAVARLDAKVRSGDITKAQRDEIVERLDEHLDRLGDGPFGGPGHGPGGGPGPGPGMRGDRGSGDENGAREPGSYAPQSAAATEAA